MQLYQEMRRGRVYSLVSKDVEEEVQELIRGQGCMQRVINKVIDRTKQQWGCKDEEAPCQQCKGQEGLGRAFS
jgi:hypothetical protein